MDDERIEHALKLGPVDEPAYQRGVRARMATSSNVAPEGPPLASTDDGPAPVSPTRIDVHPRAGSPALRTPRLATLAQLAAVVVIAVMAAAIALPGIVGSPAPSGDALDALHATGSIRMLVPEGPPQTVTAGGVRIGFDIDVARALAEELTLRPNVMPVELDPDLPASAWDVSVGMRDLGTTRVSQPYAYWPAWLATNVDSGLTTLDAVAGHPICIVGSSAAEGWLHLLPPRASAPSGPVVVRAQSDEECIAALAEGRVDAVVTNMLFDDELASRGLVAVGTEPVAWEPRVVQISATDEDAASLLAAIDESIDDLRASGRLADLSRQSFGGRDLTQETP